MIDKNLIKCRTFGRALLLSTDNALYMGRGYSVYRSTDGGHQWQLDVEVDTARWKTVVAQFQPSARLLRHYVGGLRLLSDGTRVLIARDGLYRAEPGTTQTSRVFVISRGSRPLNLGIDPQDRLIFGEYGSNPNRHEIHLYASNDHGRTFDVVYTFAAGDVRHIHNVLYDTYLNRFWVFAGDYRHEPGIGILDNDFSHLEWLHRGKQLVRVVGAIVDKEYIYFGTDTELEQNFIVKMDKITGKLHKLRPIEGTSLHATQMGPFKFVSTTVEPSPVNRVRSCVLYMSCNGEEWQPLAQYRKDLLPCKLFQFGAIVLPYCDANSSCLMFSGQAVAGLHNTTIIFTTDEAQLC